MELFQNTVNLHTAGICLSVQMLDDNTAELDDNGAQEGGGGGGLNNRLPEEAVDPSQKRTSCQVITAIVIKKMMMMTTHAVCFIDRLFGSARILYKMNLCHVTPS